MSTEIGPTERLQHEPMSVGQWNVVAICIGILALDGYDVLSIAFAAPGITAEWGISKATLGVVLSLELMGMALGSILMGALADSRGRRPTLLLGLVILTAGMLCAGIATNVYVLGCARVFTGIGVGGVLAAAMATSSDFCSDKNRALAVGLVAGGFAFGVYLGAAFLAPLLREFDWRITFHLGAFLSLMFIPLVYFFVPETITFILRKRPEDALERIQNIMRRFEHPVPESLPLLVTRNPEPVGFTSLFKSGFASVTCILLIAYLGNVGTYYYFVKWMPTIVSDFGYSSSEATTVLGIISLGGVIGSVVWSITARFLPIRPSMALCLISAAIGVAVFPDFTETLQSMKTVGFISGLFMFAALSGFFGLFADSYPSSLLGSGSGLVLGIGRGGAVLGPVIPGFLFAAGITLDNVAILMASGSFFAGVAVLFLRPQVTAKAADDTGTN